MFEFESGEYEEGPESVPITPIMDMLVAIVFFLLLSSSFNDLTQQSVPTKQSVEVAQNDETPSISPKLIISRELRKVKESPNGENNLGS